MSCIGYRFIILIFVCAQINAMQKDTYPIKKTTAFQKKSNKVKKESIWRAASNGNLERVKLWLQKEPTLLYAMDEYGNYPLHWAVFHNRHKVIDFLLGAGADCNLRDMHGKTVLHWVNQVETANILIQAGADPNIQDNLGKTPLHWIDNEQIIKLLIRAGADVDIEDYEGKLALSWAAGLGHSKIVQVLINAGANINAKDKTGKTVLHLAVMQGNYNIVKFLLSQKDIDVDAQDFVKKRCAVHWALRMCRGASKKINIQNSIPLTARLIIALIEKGANAQALDRWHRIPDRRIMFMECSNHEKNVLHMAVQYNSLTNSHQQKLLDQLKMLE